MSTITENKLSHQEKALLQILGNGRAHTLIELENQSGINRSDLSALLTNLMSSSWLAERGNRKRRYYFMSSNQIDYLKKLNLNIPMEREIPKGMKYCRHCYKHLAGYVGVKIAQAMETKGFLIPNPLKSDSHSTYQVTPRGENWFASLGIDTASIVQKGGHYTKQCLDFSERKNHLGGKLGDALLASFFEKGFAKQVPNSREIKITPKGRLFLKEELEIDLNK